MNNLLNFINFRHSLVKVTYQGPEELNDDTFIKYLIVFKKWLAIEELAEDKQQIRNAFITQFKPKDTLSRNGSYAPYLPADDDGTGSYVRMLDKKYSLEPLKRALDLSENNAMSYEELPSGIMRKVSVCFILSFFFPFVFGQNQF